MAKRLFMMNCLRPQCGKKFKQKRYGQAYCCRDCYYTSYKEGIRATGFPSYMCAYCGKETKLDFDPIKKFKKLEEFVCSHCNKKRRGVE